MLEVLFRLIVAGGLMVGSVQLPPLFVPPASGGLSQGLEENDLTPLHSIAATMDVA